jgi:hypothetical protein
MTPILEPTMLHRLSEGGPDLSGSIAVVLLMVLNAALLAKILLRSPSAPSRRDATRVLDVVVVPLLVVFAVFIAVIVEQLFGHA